MKISFAQTEPAVTTQPLTLRPSLAVMETYDDNINLTASKDHDFITVVTPGLGLSYQGVKADLTFDYQAGLGFYSRNPDLNTTKHTGSINAGYRWSQTLRLRMSDSFLYSPDATDINPTGIVTTRTNQYNNNFVATVSKQLSVLTGMDLGYSNDIQRYEGSSLIDSTVHGLQLSLSHGYSPASTISATTGFRYFIFDNGAEQKVYLLSLGWMHNFSETFSLDVTGGANLYQDANGDYSPSGLLDLSLRKSWKYASAALIASQNLTVAGGFVDSSVINRSVGLDIQKTLAEKLRATLSGSYATNESISGSSIDTSSYNGSATLDYDIRDWLRAQIRYSYFQQNSQSANISTFNRNQAFVSLTATLPER